MLEHILLSNEDKLCKWVNDNRPIEIVAIMPDKGGYTLFYYKK